jgi:hypothetical protein
VNVARAGFARANPVSCATRPSDARDTIARVRRLIQIVLVALGIRAFLRWRRSRREAHTLPPAEVSGDPADELRQKLESREDEAVAPQAEAPPAAAVADRRADVHEQGRAAIDEMTSSDDES